ncbi:MAG: Ig-like domain-containing protein [Clostridia bacterium]
MKRWISALTALALTLLLGIGAQAESPADARYRALMKLEQLAQTVYPSAIKVMPARATLLNLRGKPGSVHLRVSTKPTLGRLTDQTITWTSEDPGIATVSKDGLVTGVAPGAVRIFAQIQGKAGPIQAACRVTVKEKPVATVTLSERDLVLLDPTQAGERTHQLSVKVLPHDATRHVIDWQTSDAAVATVSSEGLVTAVRAGVATITATVIGTTKADSVEVRVRDKSRMTPITISAGGDIVLGGDPLRKSDKRFEQLISQSGAPDYGYVLKNLVRLFSKDDITILNLEGPLKGGKPRDGGRKYNFYGKPEYANILTAGSVEVANIANNHINDFGTKSATKSILRKAGITLSDTSFDTSNCTMTVRGVTVGFLGFQTPASPSTIRNRVRQIKRRRDCVDALLRCAGAHAVGAQFADHAGAFGDTGRRGAGARPSSARDQRHRALHGQIHLLRSGRNRELRPAVQVRQHGGTAGIAGRSRERLCGAAGADDLRGPREQCAARASEQLSADALPAGRRGL